MRNERPGLREQLAIALSGANMVPAEGREVALDRIGAFGAAQNPALGRESPFSRMGAADAAIEADAEPRRIGGTGTYASVALDMHAPAGDASAREGHAGTRMALANEAGSYFAYDASAGLFRILPARAESAYATGSSTLLIEPRLAALLVRFKYVEAERSASLAREAVALFADVLRRRNRRGALAEYLPKVARQSIVEWISGACPDCHGVGQRGARSDGIADRLVPCKACQKTGYVRAPIPLPDGRQVMARISCPACCGKLRVRGRERVRGRSADVCSRCAGAGHFVPSDRERADAIGVTLTKRKRADDSMVQFLHKRWVVLFDTGLRSVRALDKRLISGFRMQLGRAET